MRKYESLNAALVAAREFEKGEPVGPCRLRILPDRVILYTRWVPKPGKIYEAFESELDEYQRVTEFHYPGAVL